MDKHDSKDSGLTRTNAARRHSAITIYIDIAIAIQAVSGTAQAARYLQDKQVDVSIALRTLMKPLARRVRREWKYPA